MVSIVAVEFVVCPCSIVFLKSRVVPGHFIEHVLGRVFEMFQESLVFAMLTAVSVYLRVCRGG